ncbi:MAG TPA: S41 family peptidase, partial [Planctomycetota bacterium]|nr:S41 family peptidase [Planctomycetota bacterium]
GGLIGLTGNPSLVDGSSVQIPTFRIYDSASRWIIENEGVAPDIEVFDVAEAMESGRDPSLESAVKYLIMELAERPVIEPAIPTPPVMGK